MIAPPSPDFLAFAWAIAVGAGLGCAAGILAGLMAGFALGRRSRAGTIAALRAEVAHLDDALDAVTEFDARARRAEGATPLISTEDELFDPAALSNLDRRFRSAMEQPR